jgi:ribosomal protein L11 methyltransferase
MNSSPAAATPVARLETDEQTAQRIADTLGGGIAVDNAAVSLSDRGDGRWQVAIHFRTAPDQDAVRALVAAAAGREAAQALRFARLPAKDWVRESIAGLKPVAAGRFLVHGAHDRGRVAANRIGIEIEAALAFGTGHHGTTRGCLLALDNLCKSLIARRTPVRRHPEVRAHGAPRRATEKYPRILDLGTGSGVLAIAAARAFRRRVLATDIDASAVQVARANARRNRAGALIEFARADGVAVRSVRRHAPFDLVFANVLLAPLKRIAAPLERLIIPGGCIVLSGLLPAQANAALAAYRGCALERRITLAGWTTLVLRRQPRQASVARRRPTS